MDKIKEFWSKRNTVQRVFIGFVSLIIVVTLLGNIIS